MLILLIATERQEQPLAKQSFTKELAKSLIEVASQGSADTM